MIPFFRRNKTLQAAPGWTNFPNFSDYDAFVTLVKKYFDQKRLKFTVEEDIVVVEDPGWPYRQLGLSNLAQMCKQSRRSQWKSLIKEHFDGMHRADAFEQTFYAQAHDYAYAAPYIGVRVYPKEYISHVGEEVTIKRDLAEDLVVLLVFDFPHSVSNIRPETTIQWEKTNEELYEAGFGNTRMNYSSEVSAEDVNGIKIWFIQGDHFFVANAVLDLQLQPIPNGIYGALVGVPHRHAVMVYPIDNLDVVRALQPFVDILQGLFKDGPGSISESLYWYRDGQLTNLPYALNGNAFEFTPPQDFLDMMNGMPAK
jgi:hypothetical protein